jgi:hypothetical protein
MEFEKKAKGKRRVISLTNAADSCKYSAEGITYGKENVQTKKELM